MEEHIATPARHACCALRAILKGPARGPLHCAASGHAAWERRRAWLSQAREGLRPRYEAAISRSWRRTKRMRWITVIHAIAARM